MPFVRYRFVHSDGSTADGELQAGEDALLELRRLMERQCGFSCERWDVTRDERITEAALSIVATP